MDLKFLLLGVPIPLLMWGLRRQPTKPSRRTCATVLGLVLLAAIAYFVVSPTFLSGEPWYQRSPWKQVILLVTMLAGMAARSLDRAIELRSEEIAQLRESGKLRRKPKLSIDLWEFSRPFLVALPTFGTLLGQAGDQELGVILLALSFQTGFFWQTILAKAELPTTPAR